MSNSSLRTTKNVLANAKPSYKKKYSKSGFKKKHTYKKTGYNNNNYGKVLNAAMKTSQKIKFEFDDVSTPSLTFAGGIPFTARLYNVNSLWNMLNGVAQASATSAVAFRNWARFYDRYLVEWVNIEVEFVNMSTGPVYVGVAFRPINNEAWDTWSKYRNIDSNTFPNKQELLTGSGGSNDRTVIKVSCKLGDLWGIDTQQLGDTTFSGPTSGNPATLQIASVFTLAPSNNAINGSSVITKIKIDLAANLYQLKLQTGAATT